MDDYYIAILRLLNVIHLENEIIISRLFEKDKADEILGKFDKEFDNIVSNKYHSDNAEWPRMSFYWLSEVLYVWCDSGRNIWM